MVNNIIIVVGCALFAIAGYLIGFFSGSTKQELEDIKEINNLIEKEKEEIKPHSVSNFADPLAGYKKIVDTDSNLYVPVKYKTGRRRRVEQRIEIGEDDRF